jgi:hypothetical protein
VRLLQTEPFTRWLKRLGKGNYLSCTMKPGLSMSKF